MILEGDPSTSQSSTRVHVYVLLNWWGLSTSVNILLTRNIIIQMVLSFSNEMLWGYLDPKRVTVGVLRN